MRLVSEYLPPEYSALGLDTSLNDGEEQLRLGLEAFASKMMEPICRELDRMDPKEMLQSGSNWWLLLSSFLDLNLDVDGIYLSEDKANGNRLKSIAFEELGRGDSGFATGLMVAFFPYVMAGLLKRADLMDLSRGKIGCWVATQRVRGSDVGDVDGAIIHSGGRHETPQLCAQVQGDVVKLSGESSPWVSFAPVAEIALVYLPLFRDGNPDFKSDGTLNSIAVMVPLDLKGVSKGPALDKLGQRALPQGSIKFENVEVPTDYIVAEPSQYEASFTAALIEGNQTLGAVFTGLARRALEHAIAYAHERRQGGTILADHQLVKYRLFDSFRRLQAMRALMRQSFTYNANAPSPQLLASVTSKTFVTENAIEVATDCLRMFGGNGLTRGFPMEKILRDARAAVTEDGDNHILSLIAGTHLSRSWQNNTSGQNRSYLEDYSL